MTPLEVVVAVLAAVGTFFVLVGTIGLLRLPDLYTRVHATSKADTLGTVLTLAAASLVFGDVVPTVKILFLLVFTFVTAPTAAHAITRAAYDQGIEPWTLEDGGEDA